jgi:type I restriction enzyme S subunit
MEKLKNIPSLRFPEFDGEWESKKLGEVAIFLDGRRKPIKSSDRLKIKGEYPYYGASGIIDYINDYIFDEEIILLGEDGENIISRNLPLAFKVVGKCWINNHAHVLKPKQNYQIDFLTQLLENVSYVQYNTGTAQPKLNQEICRGIPLTFPCYVEQTKIASFLNGVDEKLQALKQKKTHLLQYKKGVMQKIFSQELRFKDDNGNEYPAWVEKKLGDILIKNSKKNKNQEFKIVQSVSNKRGFVNQDEYFEDRIIASKDLSNYYVIQKGDFAYNPSRIDVGSLAYKFDNNTSVISPLYISFKTVGVSLVDAFLLEWFTTQQFTRQMNSSFEGSVRNTLSYESLRKIEIAFPSLEEQNKIANFLSAIDDKINHCQAQIEKTEVWKKGLLQQMFV